MTIDLHRTLLLWDPGDPSRFGVDPKQFEGLGMQTLCVPYHRLGRDPSLIDRIRGTGAEAIVFTRNDDMEGSPAIGPVLAQTGMGYTTISALDSDYQAEQVRACTADFLNQKGIVDLPDPPINPGNNTMDRGKGTFTLIFDMEQVGGVRFGLPRLLSLIEPLGIRATFFVTGFIASIYPEVLKRLAAAGHEVAAHGNMHEFFSGRSFEDQLNRLTAHVEHIGKFAQIRGANLMYRMDPNTLQAMASAGISYFVLFRKHRFYRSRSLRPSTKPRTMWTGEGLKDLTLFPVSVETYRGDRGQIKAATESALRTAVQEGTRHISILMHPFKDGSLKRMELTRGILEHLVRDLGLRSVTLDRCPIPPPAPETAARILYRWNGCPRSGTTGAVSYLRRLWWQPLEYHTLRTEQLSDALTTEGRPVVFTAAESGNVSHVSIFPETGTASCPQIKTDPLCFPKATARMIDRQIAAGKNLEVRPPAPVIDAADCVLFHLPRTAGELILVLGKIVRRIREFAISRLGR